MRRIRIESIPQDEHKNCTHLDVEVYYTKGGSNFLSGGYTKRGYYVSVMPVTRRGEGMVSFTLFTGVSDLLLETNRFTAKQFEQAISMGRERAPELVSYVLEKQKSA